MEDEKVRNYIIAFLVTLLVGLGIIAQIKFAMDSTDIQKKVLKKIDKIEQSISLLETKKDSLKTVIVTIEREIDKNNKDYEKIVNTIVDSSDSINYEWAKQYIEEYRKNLK